MAHQRKIIRAAIALALSGNTAALAEVSTNRQNPYRTEKLPAIDIFSASDDVEDDSTAPRELEHSYLVEVRGTVKAAGTIDDDMDDLAEEIEEVMHRDPYFDGACADSILTSTTFEFDASGDRDIATISLIYNFTYRTDAPDAPLFLDDLETVHATHKIGAAQDDDDDAEDEIEIPVTP